MKPKTIIFAALLLAASVPALAQSSVKLRYRWHDARGQMYYSDSLSNEAIQNGYDLVSDQGLVVQRVPRALTPGERAAANKLAEQKAAAQRQVESQAREDQQLLNAYPDEAAYVRSQRDKLSSIDQQVGTTRSNVHTQERALTDLLTRAGDLERAKQPVPKNLRDRIAAQRAVVANQRALLDRLQKSHALAVEKNTADLARYRQLQAAQARQREGSE